MSTSREALLQLLVERSYNEGDFLLSSGLRSSYYVDVKRTSYDARGRRLIGEALADWLAEHAIEPDCLGGLTLGADAITHALGAELERRGQLVREASVRKAPKGHGAMRLIEGNLETGDRVLVLDDVVTTGGSTVQAIEAFREAGADVLAALALVDRGEGGAQRIAGMGVPFEAVFALGDLQAARAAGGPGGRLG